MAAYATMISTTSYRINQSTPEQRSGCPIHLLSVFATIGGDRLALAPHQYSTGMILNHPLVLTPSPPWMVDYVQWWPCHCSRLCGGPLGRVSPWCVALQLAWLRTKGCGELISGELHSP